MLVVEQLSLCFPGRSILDRVSFQLCQGTIACLVGGNGSGKTTRFNVISGFLRPRAGTNLTKGDYREVLAWAAQDVKGKISSHNRQRRNADRSRRQDADDVRAAREPEIQTSA